LSVFLSVGAAVVSVSLGTPAHLRRKLELWVAAVMLLLWTTALLLWPYPLVHREPLLSAFFAAVGIVGVTLLVVPGVRSAWQRLWAGAFLVGFVALLSITFLDWPVWPDAVPEPLLKATGGDRNAIGRFHSYYLGGFIDHDWLWRIDARPEVLEVIAPRLGLTKVDNAPRDFWLMPPYYWPGSLPPGAQLFSTPGFSRGAGDQYFMLVDVQRRFAVVWVKELFG
jgi:hypothetical protein